MERYSFEMQRLGVVRAALAAVFVCALLAGGIWLRRPALVFEWREFRTGNEIIFRVETFRKTNGKLPETLEEVGIKALDPKVFYRKIGPLDYLVWFGTTLGESETYNSRSKKWE
jgi:hypothetical protein